MLGCNSFDTGVELELCQDYDMFSFCEQAIWFGLSVVAPSCTSKQTTSIILISMAIKFSFSELSLMLILFTLEQRCTNCDWLLSVG